MSKTWAYLIAATAFYVPANVFPVMTVTDFGAEEPDTIASGVVHLFASGETLIALVVLVASLLVPILKLLAMGYLAATVQLGVRSDPGRRARLFRAVDTIGRWSMVDIFMVSILVAVVQLGRVAKVEAGLGATCFAAVVILTMFAAESFDQRLIWDVATRENDE